MMYRRGNRRAVVNLPVYSDINTPRPFVTKGLISEESKKNAKKDHVHLDSAMLCAGNATSLQVTMQASCLLECIQLYDQLVSITSVIDALMAASPAVSGVLVDTDSRLSVMGIHNNYFVLNLTLFPKLLSGRFSSDFCRIFLGEIMF